MPFERSGHSSDIFGDYLVIFGGIWDVTKELNDLHLYSFNENRWITVLDSANSPTIGRSPVRQNLNTQFGASGAKGDSPMVRTEMDSPYKRGSTKKMQNTSQQKAANTTAKKR